MKTRKLFVVCSVAVLLTAAPAALWAGCRVRMFQGQEWITCFVGNTACTTIWEGSTMVAGPICETVIAPVV